MAGMSETISTLVGGEPRERQAGRHLGQALERPVVLAGREFDDGVPGRPERDAAEMVRAFVGPARAGFAPCRPLRGGSAVGAEPACPPPGVALSAGGVLAPMAPGLQRGASAAA